VGVREIAGGISHAGGDGVDVIVKFNVPPAFASHSILVSEPVVVHDPLSTAFTATVVGIDDGFGAGRR